MIEDDIQTKAEIMGKCPGFRASEMKHWKSWCGICGYHKQNHKKSDPRKK